MSRKEDLILLLENVKTEMIDLDFFAKEFYRVFFAQKDEDKIPHNEESYMKELALMCAGYTSSNCTLNSFYSKKDLVTKINAWGKSLK